MLSRVYLFVTLWTVAHQAPLSMEFSRQKYWSGLPFPTPISTSIRCSISLVTRKMRYYFILTKMAIVEKTSGKTGEITSGSI